MNMTIYHNPLCSKSRATLSLLKEHNAEFYTVEYLKMPPDSETLADIIKKLGIPAAQLVRQKDPLFKELDLKDQILTDQQWIEVMIANPKLIERPIVVTDDAAVIGRPPENVLALLK